MADRNPYYNDPFLAQIASNLTSAFVDKNPGQTMVAREHANVYRLQGSKLQSEIDKRSAIANTFRNLKGRAPTPDEVAALTADAVEGSIKPGDLGGYTLYNASNSGQDDSAIARAFVGSGKGLNKGEAVSLGDRENIRSKDAANDKARSDSSAGIAAGATIQSANIRESGANARHGKDLEFKEKTRFDKTDSIPSGNAAFPNRDNPNFPPDFKPGTIPAPKPEDDGRWVETENPAKPGTTVWSRVRDGLPGKPPATPKPAATADISPNEIADIEFHTLNAIGAITPDGKAVLPEFKKLHGKRMEGAKIAAAKAYQQTRSAAEAQRAYREYLGIQEGSTLETPGVVSRIFGATPKIVGPDGTPAPAGPNPAAAASPSATLPPAVAAGLKEGVQTTFGNGQVWTKQNGAPVRVK